MRMGRMDGTLREDPELMRRMLAAPELRRLAGVGMDCGCGCTAFPFYRGRGLEKYNRLRHSVGVARIVWRFTGDERQCAAGLLHDIATPAFAHTVDFLQGDHLRQESTEDGTARLIEESPILRSALEAHGLTVDDVADHHRYPLVDNNSPRLSADRLEYTLTDLAGTVSLAKDQTKEMLESLRVVPAEDGAPELAFSDESLALDFTAGALRNARWYAGEMDRFIMQALADLLRLALEREVLAWADLYRTEAHVTDRLLSCPDTARLWTAFTRLDRVETSPAPVEGVYCVRVPAKKRYIDPLLLTGSGPVRMSRRHAALGREIRAFLKSDQSAWLYCPGYTGPTTGAHA